MKPSCICIHSKDIKNMRIPCLSAYKVSDPLNKFNIYETSMIAANATEFTSSAKPNTHEQNYGGSIRPLKIKFCTDETPMHYRTQQGHEQTWGFHAHQTIKKYNFLNFNKIIKICMHETPMHYRTQQGHEKNMGVPSERIN